MTKKNVTLKIDSELYSRYRKYCKDKGLIVSRQVEIFMEFFLVTNTTQRIPPMKVKKRAER